VRRSKADGFSPHPRTCLLYLLSSITMNRDRTQALYIYYIDIFYEFAPLFSTVRIHAAVVLIARRLRKPLLRIGMENLIHRCSNECSFLDLPGCVSSVCIGDRIIRRDIVRLPSFLITDHCKVFVRGNLNNGLNFHVSRRKDEEPIDNNDDPRRQRG